MISKTIGLDIGLSKLKAISLSKQNNNFVFDSFSIVTTPPKGLLSEAPLDEQEMSLAIKKTIDGLKVNSKTVNIALPDNQVYTKVIEMPVLSDKELSLAIYWEAERHIPVALSTVTLAWNVLKRPSISSSDEKMQVLMVGAPTKLIGKYQRALQMANLSLDSIETETLAIVRALATPNMPPTVIVSIGAINTSLAIIKDGILILTYSIQTGGNAISRAIETDFNLTPEQSEEYKKTYGLSKEGDAQKIGKSTGPILDSILLEIKKTLAYYAQRYKDESIVQQILLSGGTAHLRGIDLYFAEKLGIETVVANPWILFKGQNLPQELTSSNSDFTIALGLAMRG